MPGLFSSQNLFIFPCFPSSPQLVLYLSKIHHFFFFCLPFLRYTFNFLFLLLSTYNKACIPFITVYYAEIGALTAYSFYTLKKYSGRTTTGLQKCIACFLGGGGRSVPNICATCLGQGTEDIPHSVCCGHWQISGCVAVLSNGRH